MSTTTITSPGRLNSVNPVGPDGTVRCFHGEVVKPLVSGSVNNPRREFYTCIKPKGDPDKCRFFKWADELPGASRGAATPSPPPPKTPFKRLREAEVTPSTRNDSPRKPASAASNQSNDHLDVIEVDDSDEEISQFLGEPSIKLKRPAKKFRINQPDDKAAIGSTTKAMDVDGRTQPLTSLKTPVKKTPNQWQAIKDDPENPFHARAAALADQTPSSPTTTLIPVDSIAQAVDVFVGIPEMVRKLQRKLTAAEKARDARTARIVQLEKELRELKSKAISLEGSVESLKARLAS